jgi:hypothetical protein
MKFILQEKKKKKNPKLTACGVRAACLNKTKKSQIFLNSWMERQGVRERENPKAETETVKPPCCEVRRPPPVTARPSLTAPLTPADCCCRRSVTPRAVRPSGSALRSGMFLFCFFFFSSLSFPVLLLHYSWQPCLLV